jgi:glutamate synthase (NADPH) small chain
VIAALGFDAVNSPAERLAGVDWNAVGCLTVDGRQMTSMPGVFAGGDLVRGPTPLLETVRDARSAARHIDAFLSETRHP